MPDVDQPQRIELAEERLEISKREVERGRVVVRTRVETRTRSPRSRCGRRR